MAVPAGYAVLWDDSSGDGVENLEDRLLDAAAEEIYIYVGGVVESLDPPTIDALTPAVPPRTLSGRGVVGATVQVVIDTVPFATLTVDSYGDWAVGYNGEPGLHDIEVRQIVGAVASAYTAPLSFLLLADPGLSGSPGDGHGIAGLAEEEKKPLPEVGLLRMPFRRPRAWGSEGVR